MSPVVILLCGGSGERFRKHDALMEKPLIKVFGKSQLYWAIKGANLSYRPKKFIFGVRSEILPKVLEEIKGFDFEIKFEVIDIGNKTNGAAETAALTLARSKSLESKDPVILIDNDCFNLLDLGSNKLSDLYPFVSTTKSINSQHCFVEVSGNNKVIKFHEKQIYGEYAISGNYGFLCSDQFFDAHNKAKAIGNEFYVSDVMNSLLTFESINTVIADRYYSFGTPEEIDLVNNSILEFL